MDTRDSAKTLVRDGLISVSTAAKLCNANASTIIRWGFRGIRTPSGEIVRLDVIRIGGRIMTSEPALLRLIARQQTQRDGGVVSGRSPAKRRHAAAEAAKQLENFGA